MTFNNIPQLQLTRTNIEDLLARLSEIVAETLRNQAEQTADILLLIADLFESVTYFIVEFNIVLTQNVSHYCDNYCYITDKHNRSCK